MSVQAIGFVGGLVKQEMGVRCAGALALLAGALSTTTVAAHGDAPSALGVATPDDQGAAVVRLTEGLAQRDGQRFVYVCPALWGDDQVGPAQGLTPDATLIGASSGLFLLDESGAVTPHAAPDAQRGRTVSLRTGGSRIWQLRAQDQLGELLEVDASSIASRFSETPPWQSMDASQARLQLVRLTPEGMLEQLLLAPDGSELSRISVQAPERSVAALARLVGTAPYVVLLVQGGLAHELGRVEADGFVSLHRAGGSIAGPVEVSGGQRFVAVGGRLARFDGERLAELDEPAIVTCLEALGEAAYACADGGLSALSRDGLGERWFSLDQLLPPSPARVPSGRWPACEQQWQRFQLDLRGVGVVVGAAQPDTTDAGADEPDASQAEPTADAGAPDANPAPMKAAHADGCGVAGVPSGSPLAWLTLLLAVTLVLRGQKRDRGGS